MRLLVFNQATDTADRIDYAGLARITDYAAELARVPGLTKLVEARGSSQAERMFAAEMVLEGLHQHLKLAREDLDSSVSYKEMVKFQLMRRVARGEGDILMKGMIATAELLHAVLDKEGGLTREAGGALLPYTGPYYLLKADEAAAAER